MLTLIQNKILAARQLQHIPPSQALVNGCLEDTFIVTTQEKQLPKVSLWKRLLELTVKL